MSTKIYYILIHVLKPSYVRKMANAITSFCHIVSCSDQIDIFFTMVVNPGNVAYKL